MIALLGLGLLGLGLGATTQSELSVTLDAAEGPTTRRAPCLLPGPARGGDAAHRSRPSSDHMITLPTFIRWSITKLAVSWPCIA